MTSKSQKVITGANDLTDSQQEILRNLGRSILDVAKTHILVINLLRSVERRENSTKLLDIMGVPYSIVEAIDGETAKTNFPFEVALMDGYMAKKGPYEQRLVDQRENKAKRTGCNHSHQKAWQIAKEIMQSDRELELVLILEDDVAIWDSENSGEKLTLALREFMKLPTKYALFAGVSFPSDDLDKRKIEKHYEHVPGSDHLLKLLYAYGNFAVFFTREGIDYMQDTIETTMKRRVDQLLSCQPQDAVIALQMRQNSETGTDGFYCTNPSIFGVPPGEAWSEICGKPMCYENQVLAGVMYDKFFIECTKN